MSMQQLEKNEMEHLVENISATNALSGLGVHHDLEGNNMHFGDVRRSECTMTSQPIATTSYAVLPFDSIAGLNQRQPSPVEHVSQAAHDNNNNNNNTDKLQKPIPIKFNVNLTTTDHEASASLYRVGIQDTKIHQPVERITSSHWQTRPGNAWGNFSYADLISMAILSSPDRKMTLKDIYSWITCNIPFFKSKKYAPASSGWKNTIRHTLSIRKRFVRIPTDMERRSLWTISPQALGGIVAAEMSRTIPVQPTLESPAGPVYTPGHCHDNTDAQNSRALCSSCQYSSISYSLY